MKDEAGEEFLAYYLVVLVDVVGQSKKLAPLKTVPTTDKEKAETVATLRETAFFIRNLRECFESYLQGATEEGDFAKTLKDPERDKLRQLLKADVRYFGFSDTSVVAVCLRNSDANCTPMNGVRAALLAAYSATLVSMRVGHLLRGGVEVGLAIPMGESEIYGPALESAYRLESEKADYPRIIVGDQLQRYLRTVANQEGGSEFSEQAKQAAAYCQRLLHPDEDGKGHA